MRIGLQALGLHTADDFRKAGVARHTVRMVQTYLDHAPQHEYVIVVRPTLEPPEDWRRPNVKIVRTWTKSRSWNLFGRELIPLQHRLDAYIAFTGTLPRLPLAVRAGVVHDVFFRTHPEVYTPEDLSIHTLNGETMIRRADLLFSVSEFTKRELVTHFRVPQDRVVVTPNGPGNPIERLDSTTISDAKLAEWGVPTGRYLLTLSTVEPRKNLPRLIEAFAQLAKEPPFADLTLAVAGGKGWKSEEVYETVKRVGLDGRVAFLGYVPEDALPALFARCELFVLASVSEGFGIPVLEAMLAGTPVVCSQGGALPEVGGDAVRYFDPLEVNSIASALREALSDPYPRAHWAEKGIAQAQQFTWERSVDRALAALEAHPRLRGRRPPDDN